MNLCLCEYEDVEAGEYLLADLDLLGLVGEPGGGGGRGGQDAAVDLQVTSTILTGKLFIKQGYGGFIIIILHMNKSSTFRYT